MTTSIIITCIHPVISSPAKCLISSWLEADPADTLTASKGIRARIGTTEMSWNSNTEKEACPEACFIKPFSARVWRTMAVEERPSISPMASPVPTVWPSNMATPPIAPAVMISCNPPRPNMDLLICQSRLGFNSSPIRKSIIPTPNSAKCITSSPSFPMRPSAKGPMAMPASR